MGVLGGGLAALASSQAFASFAYYGASPSLGGLAVKWTGNLLATGIVYACGVIPMVVLGPFLSARLERASHRRALVTSNAVCALACAALAFCPGRVAGLYWTMFALAICNLVAIVARNAVLPDLVASQRLVTANAVVNGAVMLGRLAGPAAMGNLTDARGAAPTCLALSGLFGLAALASIKLPQTGVTRAGRADVLRDTWAGLRYALGTPLPRALIVSTTLYFLAGGAINMLEFGLSVSVFGTGTAGYGYFMSVAAGGLVLGSALAGRFLRRNAFAAYTVGGVAAGLTTLTLAFAPSLASALAIIFCAGVCEAFRTVANNVLLQQWSREDMRARAFGAQTTLAALGLGVTYLITGPLVTLIGLRPLIIASAALMAGSGAVAVWLARPARRAQPDHYH